MNNLDTRSCKFLKSTLWLQNCMEMSEYLVVKGLFNFHLFLTLVMLNPDISCFANSVDPDQFASEEAN